MKNVLVIGASGGIGENIVEHLARLDLNLILAIHASPISSSLESLIKDHGLPYYQVDISDPNSIQKLYRFIQKDIGTVDILINCAGTTISSKCINLVYEDWMKVINVNLTGVYLITKYVLPGMIEKAWGRIIHIGSVVGSIGVSGTSAYAASKAGVEGFVRAVATETANAGVTINCIAPGYMNTGMLFTIPEEIKKKIIQTIPLKRFGNPSEISHLITFLISENSSYITGQTLQVNGGLT